MTKQPFGGWTGNPANTNPDYEKKPAKTVKDWEDGETLLGFWQTDKEYPGDFGPIKYHVLVKAALEKDEVVATDEVVVLRSGAGLANQFKDLEQGQLVEIIYDGKTKNEKSGRFFHKFSSRRADNKFVQEFTQKEEKEETDFSDDE